MLGIIRRVFSFSDHAAHHPMEPPPGNMLDASFDAQNSRIAEIQAEVGALRRSDGQLQNGLVTADAVHPAFKAELTDELAAKLRKSTENVEKHALETGSAAFKAESAAKRAELAQKQVETAEIAVLAAESEISGRIHGLTARAEVLNAAFSRTATDLWDLSATVTAGEGSAEAWAETSRLWAEHMPGTIPEEALSESDVSGDHWSSRWWANYAAQIVEDGLGLPGPPGEPGEPGSPGPPGPGVPAGGSTGQVLTKASAADFDSTWMPGGSAPAWDSITGKPATFPPTVPIAWTDVSGKPATFPPTLPIASSGVTGLDTAQSAQDTAIAGKAATVHTHAQADVTNLVTDLAGKAPTVHTHAQAEITGLITALAGKEPTITAGTSAQYWQGTKSWQTLDKAAVGLANVDNTADSAKPVSTAQQTALDGKVSDTGDTMTGDLTITKAAPVLDLRKTAANESSVNFRTGTNLRWKIISDSGAEGGSNAGSQFRIVRHDDAGAQIENSLTISRATGTAGFIRAVAIANGLAPVAGGSQSTGITLSNSGIGVFNGSGAPTFTAPQGSLYLRSNGTGTNDRIYVNTNGSTGWAAMSVIAVGTSAPSSPAANDVWIDTT